MKRIILIVLAVALLAGISIAQEGQKIYFGAKIDPAFSASKTLAPAKACTTDYMTWYWAGSMSSQIYVGGRTGDSVIVETKFKQSNYNAVAAWKTNADSIVTVDSIIGAGYGKLTDFSTKADCSRGGVLIFTNKSWTLDSAKYFQAYPIITPAK